MPVTQILSNTLIDIEQHFRVSAGPGAGKTYWLVNHIRNVLYSSQRLEKARKIACITYTNVAVETILRRLGNATDRVEASTIHSFLYNHVVKPYAAFIPHEYGLNVQKIDGHEDVILTNYLFLRDWKTRTTQHLIKDDRKLVEAFKAIRWRFDDSGNLVIKPDFARKIDKYSIKTNSYIEYKKMAWERGVLHHDDVLFFSYQLIQKHPFILQVLRAKFPYFFVDEFQDTNPIQAKILEQIGQKETIVGVIGDKAQSIYSFQGADPSQFSAFTLPNLVDYEIADNRRSTSRIVDLLNTIRNDIQQNKVINDEGEKPTIITGEMSLALRKAQELCGNEQVNSLSRDNITSNAMKRGMDQGDFSDDTLLDSLNVVDSNRDRKNLIIACIKGVELARQNRFKEALKQLERVFKHESDSSKGKREALKHIICFLQNYDDFKGNSLLDFHSFVGDKIQSVAALKTGAVRTFYEGHTYQQLAVCVKITDDASLHRTIHKAKGAEFDNVLVILKDERDLEFLQNPDLSNEEHRINYVAVSRAKKRLFISVPTLSGSCRTRLGSLFDIVENQNLNGSFQLALF
jgi:DNA helicase-2/ATP-dependent DNA helicase PcrA